jgi:putative ATPase
MPGHLQNGLWPEDAGVRTVQDMFERLSEERIEREAPLAARMRPRTLDEFVGQEHIIGPGRLLRRAIQADQLSSLIFYGPPGTGKTTLARIIANTTRAHFITINAVLAGVSDIREAIRIAQERRGMYNQRTILFVDEVHRFNKAQQDALLPHVENGTIILIGATTENPYFEVIKPLVSRSRIFELKPLSPDELRRIAMQALRDPERGYGKRAVRVDEDALEHLINVANGDARALLNALELAVETTPPGADGIIHVDLSVAEESIQRRAVLYDRDGDAHFDTISAFIKSLRGSDPDAALYWLARMLYAGEDPRFILRRMLIFAGEDVGMADPHAIQVVAACAQAFDYVGLPEGRFHLALACLYLATAPKSNSAFALWDAIRVVEQEREGEVPAHLKDASRDAEGLGHGTGYLYPHAYRDHWVAQQYLPDNLVGRVFYQPTDQGYENLIREQVARRREAQLAAMLEDDLAMVASRVVYEAAHGTGTRRGDAWLQRTLSNVGEHLAALRERVMAAAQIERHSLVLDLNAGSGLLTWEAVRRASAGGVWALAWDERTAQALRQQAANLDAMARPVILCGALHDLPTLIAQEWQRLAPAEAPAHEKIDFDVILGRNALVPLADKAGAAAMLATLLAPGGRVALAETVARHGQRLYRLFRDTEMDTTLYRRWAAAEEALHHDPADPLVSWDADDLATAFRTAGFVEVHVETQTYTTQQQIHAALLARWFAEPGQGGRPSYAQRLRHHLSAEEIAQLRALLEQLRGQVVDWQTCVAYLVARAPHH